MMKKDSYILVDSAVLPEVFLSVINAKKLLDSGKARTINQAASMAGISRSAFYKYKDSVFQFEDHLKDRIITLYFKLADKPGVLSELLHELADSSANVLTINQNIPANSTANVTISIQASKMTDSIEDVIARLKTVAGVKKIEIY